ncbi:MAG: hypothetical protein J7647_32335 [Cyanobacteria bacterium SBLK]|nr:hypothetical protein [Cyanobacteria bacterium SBLK]
MTVIFEGTGHWEDSPPYTDKVIYLDLLTYHCGVAKALDDSGASSLLAIAPVLHQIFKKILTSVLFL